MAGWQPYTDSLKQHCAESLFAVGIYGVQGGVWHAEGINLSNEECTKLSQAIDLAASDNGAGICASGFTLGGHKFSAVRVDSEDGFLVGKSKKDNTAYVNLDTVVFKTNTAIFVGIGKDGFKASQMTIGFEKVTKGLKEAGY